MEECPFLPGKPENLKLCALRGLGGSVAQGLSLYAYTVWNLSDVATIAHGTIPIWAAVSGIIFLGQPWKRSIGVSLVGCTVGMLFITPPAFFFNDEESPPKLALVASILSAAVAGSTELLIQQLQENHWALTW